MVPHRPSIPKSPLSGPIRIETQIHRRKKAKALSALKPEWESADLQPPSHLRMPSDQMGRSLPGRPKKVQ